MPCDLRSGPAQGPARIYCLQFANRPILTPKTVLPLFFAVGIIFAPIGGLLLYASSQVGLYREVLCLRDNVSNTSNRCKSSSSITQIVGLRQGMAQKWETGQEYRVISSQAPSNLQTNARTIHHSGGAMQLRRHISQTRSLWTPWSAPSCSASRMIWPLQSSSIIALQTFTKIIAATSSL